MEIIFSKEILIENFDYDNSINFSVTGPLSPYNYSSSALFIDNKTLSMNISVASKMVGNKQEKYMITLNNKNFKNEEGIELKNNTLSGSLYRVSFFDKSIQQLGSSGNSLLSTTIVAFITTQVMFSDSIEMLWGFINTLQIMYFWPVLSLYYPDNLREMLIKFSSAKLQVSFPLVDIAQRQVELAYYIDQPPLNENFQDIEYESTSILVNGFDFMRLLFQGIISCIFIFSFRA